MIYCISFIKAARLGSLPANMLFTETGEWQLPVDTGEGKVGALIGHQIGTCVQLRAKNVTY